MPQFADDWMELLVALPREDRARLVLLLTASLDEPADPAWENAWTENCSAARNV